MKATFSNKTVSRKLLENHILSFLKTEASENELDETARRDDKNTMILTKIEDVLHKIRMKESQNILPVQNLTLRDNEVNGILVKLPKLEISKFNGIILNWQGF